MVDKTLFLISCGPAYVEGQQDGKARRAVIVRPAQGLQPDQGWRALPVVGADVNAEADFRPAITPADGRGVG